MSDLRHHWPALLAGYSGLRDGLVEAYEEPHRGYHDVRHLAEVLERIDVLLGSEPESNVERDAVLLAAWFHDAVYDPDGDNEERSAALAERELTRTGLPPRLVAEVARLVRMTATHRPPDRDAAGGVLCDADLGILAADEERYDQYVRGVRQEYGHLSDADFRAGRTAVLRALLEPPTLFRTGFAREHWEERARRNIERELAVR